MTSTNSAVHVAPDATAPASEPARGIFITFEGGDGAGKSTHIKFLAQTLEARGYEVLRLREPGGTVIGEALRDLVLDPAHAEMDPRAELLIYEAARAQIVEEVIRPAILRGAVVLCDRFFDSTVAYQGYGRGIDLDFIDHANAFACDGVVPDKTILMVSGLTPEESLERATRSHGADRLELAGVEFHTRVNQGFAQLAAQHPERVSVVESSHLRSETSCKVFEALLPLFPWMQECLDAGEAFFGVVNEGHVHD